MEAIPKLLKLQIPFIYDRFLMIQGVPPRAGGGKLEGRSNFFQHVNKLLIFWNFVNIKVAKFEA